MSTYSDKNRHERRIGAMLPTLNRDHLRSIRNKLSASELFAIGAAIEDATRPRPDERQVSTGTFGRPPENFAREAFPAIDDAEREMIRQGRPIPAIKSYRARHGYRSIGVPNIALIDAKNVVVWEALEMQRENRVEGVSP